MELTQLKREVVYRGRIFDLWVDDVRYPSGNLSVREIAHHPGGAVTVPVLEDGRVVLVRQLRYPFATHILELPAGKLSPGEDPAQAAARELLEETGWSAGTLEPLVSIMTTPAFCDEVLHLFLARGLRLSPDGPRREEGEFSMSVALYTMEEIFGMIAAGEIRDAKTIVGLYLARERMGQ